MITVDVRYTLPEYLDIARGLAGYHVRAKCQRQLREPKQTRMNQWDMEARAGIEPA